ncbi:nuclear transport factor 2 family protein [Actinokineospora auranticolor]|uniref:SnoaL-like protein n=1 Tax=Actinokineospora auranticolor TaxID=155976 RepID=A0A2S6GDB9_9PSEU|nr:nuclear transport factor 2 family protein [Actinokineospora auranticolor]PPK63245.1 SnoaL-like protein [Actinokineospora auranticolor]
MSTFVTRTQALTTPAENFAATIRELRDRAEVVDALHRFAQGQDLRDRDLFASSFTGDATLDFRPTAAKWGAEPPVLVGREGIADAIFGLFAGRVDTTHRVTNTRVSIDGDTAHCTALVEAQHLLTIDHTVHALLNNYYDTTLHRTGDHWRIHHLRIDNVWLTGTPKAIFDA